MATDVRLPDEAKGRNQDSPTNTHVSIRALTQSPAIRVPEY